MAAFNRSVEESQAMAARHQAEINAMRAHCASLQQQIQQQQKDYDELTQQMRQLVEAQWNAVNRFPAPCGKRDTYWHFILSASSVIQFQADHLRPQPL